MKTTISLSNFCLKLSKNDKIFDEDEKIATLKNEINLLKIIRKIKFASLNGEIKINIKKLSQNNWRKLESMGFTINYSAFSGGITIYWFEPKK